MCPLLPTPRVAECVSVTSGPSTSLPLFGLPDNVLDTKVTAEQPRHTIYTTIKGERKIITFLPLYQWKISNLSFHVCSLRKCHWNPRYFFPKSCSNILLPPESTVKLWRGCPGSWSAGAVRAGGLRRLHRDMGPRSWPAPTPPDNLLITSW